MEIGRAEPCNLKLRFGSREHHDKVCIFFVFRIAEGKGICEAKNSTQRGILSNVHPGREEAFILTIGRSCLFRRGYRTEGKVQIEVVSIPVIVLEG